MSLLSLEEAMTGIAFIQGAEPGMNDFHRQRGNFRFRIRIFIFSVFLFIFERLLGVRLFFTLKKSTEKALKSKEKHK